MKFTNTENPVITHKGKQIHISRSIAVVMIPIFRLPDNSLHIPTGVRSNLTPDHQGKIGLVCGYLDWDESAFGAAVRETWEELGLNLTEYLWNGDLESVQPYFVQSHPAKDDRQNVTLRYRLMFDVMTLPKLSKGPEVHSAQWLGDSSAILAMGNTLETDNADRFAFNHWELVRDAFAIARDCSGQHKHYPNGPYLSI
jgi:8-oxo-dGTP pyrophosphatase MutT (NUDIX family)